MIPFWPSMLAKLTGHHNFSTPELSVAIKAAQRLVTRCADDAVSCMWLSTWCLLRALHAGQAHTLPRHEHAGGQRGHQGCTASGNLVT